MKIIVSRKYLKGFIDIKYQVFVEFDLNYSFIEGF